MSDNKSRVGKQDRLRVDANDINEVEHIHQLYPDLTHQEILDAVKKYGPMRETILNYLNSVKKTK
jgi:hypothetical protein